ncbi:nucleolar transcription factor 1-B [Abrus precatorius]|uniref:Nucleolar transcription factor 1-B n=1 Tax=Abrus precatorius TaxID=3816 RepID=A0A8B8LKP4_ABRPR|nr:nucleolar transcription factor 1-B [Abrus precatorius]
MESDDDYQLLPSFPVHERKLKRLKKAKTAPHFSHPTSPPTNFSELGNSKHLEESIKGSGLEPQSLGLSPQLDTVKDDCLGATRVLEFDSVGDELDGKVAEEKEEVVDLKIAEEVVDLKITEEVVDLKISEEAVDLKSSEEIKGLKTEELERKRRSFDELPEKKQKKKKKRIEDSDGSEKKPKESMSSKRKAEKERQETLRQLRAESQRLLRETRDAAFKPAPLVQKPISSILDKIRQRKLEILKKSSASFEDNDKLLNDEEITDKVEKGELEEPRVTCPATTRSGLNVSHIGGSNVAADNSSCKSIPSPTVMDVESEHVFRAPIDDTQELFSDSQGSDTKDDDVNEKSNNLSEEMFAPSMLSMNLKLDSAPPDDDDDISSDEEDNDKENIDPHLHGSVDLTLPPSGDPVKAFVDEEAEEEDDSDNDLQRFQDNEEGEDNDDIEELDDMIATEYKEKAIDREKRDQLHQQWLEQQDTAGMDNLLQKLNCGSKLKETTSIEEEDEESRESENESDDEAEEYIAPSEAMKINLKKVKQMIPLMYTDKDDKYVSSDDEETEEKLTRQYLYHKTVSSHFPATLMPTELYDLFHKCLSKLTTVVFVLAEQEEKTKFFSPAEDESSREVFSLIKKLNVVPETKRKGRPTSIFDMPRIGQNINISSKSSFLGRASNHFMHTSQKHGSSKVRSFIFERDDSNSRTSVSMPEDSSDTIQKESQPPKAVSAKFQRNTQNKYTSTLNSASQKSTVSLLEILRRSSRHAEHFVQNATVQAKGSVFDAFKLVKKPIKTEARI